MNQLIRDNPIVGVLIFGALGVVLLAIGLREMKSGEARGKYGRSYTGSKAKAQSGFRIAAGIACFGIATFFITRML